LASRKTTYNTCSPFRDFEFYALLDAPSVDGIESVLLSNFGKHFTIGASGNNPDVPSEWFKTDLQTACALLAETIANLKV